MPGKERADLGFADALESFDPADWTPGPPKPETRPPRSETRKAAAAAGFRSREPQPAIPAEVSTPTGMQGGAASESTAAARPPGAGQGAPQRRRRTGRTAQLNLKLRPETIAAFTTLADSHGWGLGETLEHAIAALQAQRSAKGSK